LYAASGLTRPDVMGGCEGTGILELAMLGLSTTLFLLRAQVGWSS
jgi:hypothetical protein